VYQSHHKFDHVFEGAPPPEVSFAVCSIPRSGSSLLCDLLATTELAGAPMEYLDEDAIRAFGRIWGMDAFEDYLDALLARKTSPNGVFGLKLLYGQLRELAGRELGDVFPNPRFIYITRRDHLRQAVSFARATQTEQWASDHPAPSHLPVFDPDQIQHMLEWIERDERLWEEYFELRSISPLRIVYEDFVAAVDGTVLRAMEHIGIELPAGFRLRPATISKQADELSEDWVRRFSARSRPSANASGTRRT
jgi:trehalose 2-sulfotransferase